MDKRWHIRTPHRGTRTGGLTGFSEPVSRVLIARGYEDAESARHFLEGRGRAAGTGPGPLGVEQAVARCIRSIERGELIVIYGDYDADGICATALLSIALQRLGARVTQYIPDRFTEGYGLHHGAIDRIAEHGCQLLITVDCGIRGVDQVRWANELGLDVIITDHHFPGAELPPAYTIINPNQPECPYPFKRLAGVGLAYRLATALASEVGQEEPEDLLDLVAIGTVADVAPLVEENRYLVSRGLQLLNSSPRPGLHALMRASGISAGRLTAQDIAFRVGPRINAAGRLGSTETAFELLVTDDSKRSEFLANELNDLNRKRQSLTRSAVELAKGRALVSGPERGIVVAIDSDFHQGVVGLAASRLAEEFYRPALVARIVDGEVVGSARSIPEFHITRALEATSELLGRFGGHAAAAGFRLSEDRLEEFIAGLQQHAQTELDLDELQPVLTVDTLVQFGELDDRVLEQLDLFEPCGEANPQPVLAAQNVEVAAKRPVGVGGGHLKMTFQQGGRYFDAIGFGLGDRVSELGGRADIAFHFTRNEYAGIISQQLQVLDFLPASLNATPASQPRGT